MANLVALLQQGNLRGGLEVVLDGLSCQKQSKWSAS
jgi:hypothetical protein